MFLNPQTIDLDGLPDLIALTGYQPNGKRLPGAGFTLAEDLANNKGGVLYAKTVELDFDKIERLSRLSENNPDWQLKFIIQKNEKLADTLRKRIYNDFDRLIQMRKARQEYRKLFEKIGTSIEAYFPDIVSTDEMVYTLTQLKSVETASNKEHKTPMYFHAILTSLTVIGIFQQAYQVTNTRFTREDIITGAQAGLLLPVGGIETAPLYKDKPVEEREIRFFEGNRNSWAVAARFGLKEPITEVMKLAAGYHEKNYEFLSKDTMPCEIAAIVSTADVFNLMVNNPFGDPAQPKEILDKLYVRASAGKVKKIYIDTLAKGLRFDSLFDFYYEIEKLNNSCPYGHGRAYPLTGFKSPVIYVCKGKLDTCQHYAISAKAVTIFRATSGLEEGSYGRCKWLSTSLIKFYDEFYEQIKEETATHKT